MKRFLTLLLSVGMLLSFALPLTACSVSSRLKRMDENKRAVCFYELINEKRMRQFPARKNVRMI